MEKSINTLLENTLEQESIKFKNDKNIDLFIAASIEFEKLVKDGLVVKRGYNLITVDNKHLKHSYINSNLFR